LETQELKIGLAFSGGGYRAASFSLGVLSYMNEITVGGKTLLHSICAISTVSGGTITGTRYAVGIKRGESFRDIYTAIYQFMTDTDLLKLSLDNLSSSKNWKGERLCSLINAAADVYDKHLFNEAKFGLLMTDETPIHLKHLSFNATEFSTAKQFRFQWSEKIKNPLPGVPERGIIGNIDFNVPVPVAANIRMADILAASSCFPGGFEPINFPTDFGVPASKELDEFIKSNKCPVGLMDGGIVDNQGIEPLILADQRMRKNAEPGAGKVCALDLVIISDVTSPYMDKFNASVLKKQNWWRAMTPAFILTINTLLLLAAAVGLFVFISKGNIALTILCTVVATLTLVVYLIGSFLKSLPAKFQVPAVFLKPLGKLLKLKLLVYEGLIMNRANALMKMAGDVSLKHFRRLNYDKIYENKDWENRRIMNAIYELREGEAYEKKIEEGKMSPDLRPSQKIKDIARTATGMGTTLWFTEEELQKKDMLNTLIASGQVTMCWNLLEYIQNLKKESSNTNPKHQELIKCESLIMAHWKQYQDDPFWLIKKKYK
jgi:predicted acylesterase/phospholipase RssA